MKAMILHKPRQQLSLEHMPEPKAGPGEVLLKVMACGICRTDLHIVDGELTDPRLPLVLGHQIVGLVEAMGAGAKSFTKGQRVGVPWLGGVCGECRYCRENRENLCDHPTFTGYRKDGGYAEYTVANEEFCFLIPPGYADSQAAPLLCAGLIGFRAYRMTGEAQKLGFYGFGSSAHILTQVVLHQGREVYAFTRPGDNKGQDFARDLGAAWAGGSDEAPPEPLDAAIIFAPAGNLVPAALKAVRKGATVICAGIHMSDIPSFPYRYLWEERVLRSVANLTRQDGEDFLRLAPKIPVRTEVTTFALEEANEALKALRDGTLQGSAVIKIGSNEQT